MMQKLLAAYKRSILLYILIVVVPLGLFGFTYTHFKYKSAYSFVEESAQRISGFHALYVESFLGETIGRLEGLAVVLGNRDGNLNQIDELLNSLHVKDSRFSGFYWLNTDGDIRISSNPITEKVNLSDRPYVKMAMRTGTTQISEAHAGSVTGRRIFSIATPIINEAGVTTGMLIGSIQLSMMEETIRNLIKDEAVQLIDENEIVMLEVGSGADAPQGIGSFTKLKVAPWKIYSIIQLDYKEHVVKPLLKNLSIAFLVANFMFMLVYSLLLKRKMSRELSQNEADKLKLIGIIAASTAHEIRNPLTGIKGFVSLLSRKYKDEKDQYYFSLIQKEVDRINTIVSELLVVGKLTVALKEINHVNDILAEIVPLIESEANLHNVQLSIRLTEEPAYIELSKDHLKQIVLNLTRNALEAMNTGGRLSIRTEKTERLVLIKVEDTGKGIPPEILRDIWKPFFTLKENGTGLGLVVCKRILDSYGGTLLIDSQVGGGTEVTIQLPVFAEGGLESGVSQNSAS